MKIVLSNLSLSLSCSFHFITGCQMICETGKTSRGSCKSFDRRKVSVEVCSRNFISSSERRAYFVSPQLIAPMCTSSGCYSRENGLFRTLGHHRTRDTGDGIEAGSRDAFSASRRGLTRLRKGSFRPSSFLPPSSLLAHPLDLRRAARRSLPRRSP